MRANNKIFTGPSLHIIGNNNTINGPSCTVEGNNNKVNGPSCIVYGNNNTVNGPSCKAIGNNNKLTGPGCTAQGDNNKITGAGFSGMSIGPVKDGIVINMRQGGMRIFNNGVEQEPFMVSKKEKKKRERVEEVKEAEIQFIEGPTVADLNSDKEAKDNEASCIVCLTNSPCCIAYPCNHLSYCVACARILCFENVKDEKPKQVGQLACPKCKKEVQKITKIFE